MAKILFGYYGGTPDDKIAAWNVDNPASPIELGTVTKTGLNTLRSISASSGGVLAVCSTDYAELFDCSDPTSMFHLASISMGSSLDPFQVLIAGTNLFIFRRLTGSG